MLNNGNNAYGQAMGGQINFNDNSVQIKRLIFVPTKEYNDIYRRPLELNLTGGSLASFGHMVEDQLSRGGKVSAHAISNSAPDMMKVSDVPTEGIVIANGWNTVRLRFLMEVESQSHGGSYISYIQGYTDYHDPSFSGRIDPEMNLNINSITNVLQHVQPGTGFIDTRVLSSFNVLFDPYQNKHSIENTTHTHKFIRPKDIVDGMSNAALYGTGEDIIDVRGQYGALPQASRRLNAVGSEHVANVINGFALAQNLTATTSDPNDALNVAASESAEVTLTDIPFIDALSSITTGIATVTFTLNLLTMLKPDLESILEIVDTSTPALNMNAGPSFLDTNVTENFTNVSMETTIATTVSDSVSSLLIDESLSVVDFSITNRTQNSELTVAVTNAKSFIQGLDVTLYVDRFINKFKTLVMPGLTKGNLISMDLFVHADVLGETTVSISLNGAPASIYRLPTFCNSLYSSMVSTSEKSNILVEDFSQLLTMTNLK